MIYDKSAVKYPQRITEKEIAMARRSPFFRSEKALTNFFNKVFRRKRSDLETMLHATGRLAEFVEYDYKHTFQGIRSPSKTLCDLKGHCIEQNGLLYVLARHLGVKTKIVVMKNPKGFKAKLKEEGFHPFLEFEFNRKTYLADQVSKGVYISDEGIWYAAKQEMSNREFTSFCMNMGGEDLLRSHKEPEEAMKYFKAAFLTDPNNYAALLYTAEALSYLGKIDEAETYVNQAIEMTPGLADPYKIWGDILTYYGKDRKARKMYCIASEMESRDFQLLYDLEGKLWRIDRSKRRRVRETKNELLKSKPSRESKMVLIMKNMWTGWGRVKEVQKDDYHDEFLESIK